MTMVKTIVQFVLTNVIPVSTQLITVYLVPQKEIHHQSVQSSHQRLDPLKLKISQSVPPLLSIVKTNVPLVLKLPTIVLLVMSTELTHHNVHVTKDTMKPPEKFVKSVHTNVSPVPPPPSVLPVLETESTYQNVPAQLEPSITEPPSVHLVITNVPLALDPPPIVNNVPELEPQPHTVHVQNIIIP